MTIPCTLKWGLSLTAGPLLAAAGVGVAILLIVGLLWAVGHVLDWADTHFAAREPMRGTPEWEVWIEAKAAAGQRRGRRVWWTATTFYGAVVLFQVWALGAMFMQSVFGCDECLPDWMQKSCTAANDDQEARDRATFEHLKAQYNW